MMETIYKYTKSYNKKGYTIFELMVVMAIVGLIVSSAYGTIFDITNLFYTTQHKIDNSLQELKLVAYTDTILMGVETVEVLANGQEIEVTKNGEITRLSADSFSKNNKYRFKVFGNNILILVNTGSGEVSEYCLPVVFSE